MNIEIELQNPYDYSDIPQASDCQLWVESTLNKINYEPPCSLVIRFVDEEEGQVLNHRYREQNHATNVLSFPYEASEFEQNIAELENHHIGDLVLCVDVVKREAKKQNKEILQHWSHLIIHGTLHLNGYDHLNDEEAKVMEDLEVTILKKLGYNNPYKTIS